MCTALVGAVLGNLLICGLLTVAAGRVAVTGRRVSRPAEPVAGFVVEAVAHHDGDHPVADRVGAVHAVSGARELAALAQVVADCTHDLGQWHPDPLLAEGNRAVCHLAAGRADIGIPLLVATLAGPDGAQAGTSWAGSGATSVATTMEVVDQRCERISARWGMTGSDGRGTTTTGTATDAGWWRDAVVYQLYIRSFADGDGDGLGDIAGIRDRLPYLRDLGVDALWINPWYPSPMADAGYDVADYRAVEPAFGTAADAAAMIDEAHAMGLRVILDIVPNHTSDRHSWFRAAVAAGPGSPERARYHFRHGRADRNGEDAPPNDWRSVFGGPAWTRLPDTSDEPAEWYLHLFDSAQPDLNWDLPEVREEFESILRFWFDRGVDGFRIDVAHSLVKDPAMPDVGPAEHESLLNAVGGEGHPFWDRDGVHEIYRGWRRVADSYAEPKVFVAEAWVSSAQRLVRYLRPDELHTAFNFDYLGAGWDADALRAVIDSSLSTMGAADAPATWVLSNHDVVRHVSRLGRPLATGHSLVDLPPVGTLDRELGRRRARAAALLMFALPGGAYVYQGDELGLWEVEDLPDAARQDPTWRRTGGAEIGRDGCRVPLPWSGAEAPFGFSPDGATGEPWLPQPADFAAVTAEAQERDPGSVLALYRAALALRREHPALGDGTLEWLPSAPGVLVFSRGGGLACLVNLSPEPVALPEGCAVLLATEALTDSLPVDAAAWVTDRRAAG